MHTVGIVGVGYWGSNYVRVFNESSECDLRWVADLNEERLANLSNAYPGLESTTDYADIRDDPGVDAVCIATPPETHFDIGREFLENGKDILVEKPFTLDSDSAWELDRIADENDRVILVGHIFEYNSAVNELRSFVQDGDLGDIYYLHSERTGLGPIRPDVSALWDLAPHDISTFTFLTEKDVTSVRCIGRSFLQDVDDSVFVFVDFDDGASGFIHCSWLYPHKTRKTTVVGDEKMAVFNDTDPERLLQIYETHVDRIETTVSELEEHHFNVREGDVVMPYIEQREPLKVQVEHFLSSIETRTQPITSAAEGAHVVEILEAAERSLQNDGEVVDL